MGCVWLPSWEQIERPGGRSRRGRTLSGEEQRGAERNREEQRGEVNTEEQHVQEVCRHCVMEGCCNNTDYLFNSNNT